MKRLRYEDGAIDEIDKEILVRLTTNARSSTAELARAVGLSAPSVSERIKRLEETGVIKQYTVYIDQRNLGLEIAAWLRIRPIPGKIPTVVKIIQNLPEIVHCDRITGEDCFIAKAYVPRMEDLEALIDELTPYAMTNTSIIQSSPVDRASILETI